VPYVEACQERGLVVDGHPEAVGPTVLYASSRPVHRDEVGRDRDPGVRDLLFRWVADGVTRA
jgi:hypothetical protein